jgi:hypothetical protein
MIKISNNNETKIVTKGAYENFYKPLGFNIVEKESTKVVKEQHKTVKESDEINKDKADEKVTETSKITKETSKRK